MSSRVFPLFLMLSLVFEVHLQAADPYSDHIVPLLTTYCVDCHSADRQKGGIDLEALSDTSRARKELKVWRKVLEQLETGAMPPEKKAQPSDTERDQIKGWIHDFIGSLTHGEPDPGRVTARRLNRYEYAYSVRDLFGITSNPAAAFPRDAGGGAGFDNNADTLFLPPVLMEQYFKAADQVLDEVFASKDLVDRLTATPKSRPDDSDENTAAYRILQRQATLTYRRPPSDSELTKLTHLYNQARESGVAFPAALRPPLKALLLSPHFLFRIERDHPESAQAWQLSAYEIATRLAYFIWGSCPDEPLLNAASQGKLFVEDTLRLEVERLLKDERAKALARHFAGQWMQTERLLTSAEPDRRRFRDYNDSLRDAMLEEAELFFDELLRKNGSMLNVINADFTYLNEPLAKLYGIDGIEGDAFQRVHLTDTRRGGILGMASFHAITSYPRRTSPVLRGKWILEQLLGTPPPPPPPDAGLLPTSEERKQSKTIRQLLEAHRERKACAGCHAKLDPLGFALENYDVLGQWRETYQRGQAVDSIGELPTGEKLSGPEDLKKVLVEEKRDLFSRTLSEQILAYALGRGIEPTDERTIQYLIRTLEENDYRSLPLILAVVESYPFQYRRNATPEG